MVETAHADPTQTPAHRSTLEVRTSTRGDMAAINEDDLFEAIDMAKESFPGSKS
jgi:hypothetical protein